MAFDEGLASRLEEIILRDHAHAGAFEETRMFGGFGYLLNGNMCLGIQRDTLIIRVGVDQAEALLQEEHVSPMDLTGRAMKGWAMVAPAGMEDDRDLARFCDLAVAFVKEMPPKRK